MLNFFHRPDIATTRCDPGVLDLDGPVDTQRFHSGIGSLDLLRALRSSRQKRRPLALDVRLTSKGATPEHYLDCLEREIDLVACHLHREQRVEQFRLGGGHPCVAQVQRLMSHLRKRLTFLDHDGGDFAIDVDLHHTDWSMMGALRDLGFNHVSISVPDIDGGGAMSVANYQNPAPINSLIDAARTFGYRSVNVDLGFGHDWQTPESFALKLQSLIELEPDRLTTFDYALPPRRYQAIIGHPQRAPCRETDKSVMRQICFTQLTAAGYHYLGMGQFVRPDDDLAIAQERGRLRRTCEGFTRHGYCDHLGFGVGAISQIDDLYTQNADEIERYQGQLDCDQLPTARGWRVEAAVQIRHWVRERLACDLELDIEAIERRYGFVFSQYFAPIWPLLEQLKREGVIELSPRFLGVLPAGRHQVDALCRLFSTNPC